MKTIAWLACAAALAAILLTTTGCTQGQLTPATIKSSLYAARADAITTAQEVRAGKQPPEAALTALDRIGGTDLWLYDDGLLAPVYHWFRGTKPQGDRK